MILLLIGVSNMLRYQMAYLEIPDAIEAALLTATTTPWLMLLYINIIQIILGIFLDMAAHILITTPLFLPLAIPMGVGPVQFGMMLLLNCALGLVHPPVGTVQFVGCAIGNISIGEATKTLGPITSRYSLRYSGDLRAGILDVAAVVDHRPPGALGAGSPGVSLRDREVSRGRATDR